MIHQASRRIDGYWLCLPPAASRIKGNPKEVPLNRIALRALAEDLPALMDGRIFRQWTNPRAFKAHWEATVRRVGLHDLRFHDLRHTFATRLQKGLASIMKPSSLARPPNAGSYSHGGPEWDRRLRDAMTRLEEGYVLVDELADERQAAKAVGSISLKTGEPAGIRTQDPRLKRAGESEEKQQFDIKEPSNE